MRLTKNTLRDVIDFLNRLDHSAIAAWPTQQGP